MIRALVLASVAVAVTGSPLAAQQWALDAHSGRIRSSLDPSANVSETVVAGIGYQDAAAAFRLSAGFPTAADASSWGAVSVYKRLAEHSRGFTSGLDLTGDGFLFRQHTTTTLGGGFLNPVRQSTTATTGNAVSASALPVIGFERGPVQIEARAGVSYYAAGVEAQRVSRTLGLGELQVTLQPSPSVAIAPILRRFQGGNEGASTFAGASGVLAQGPASVWASAGHWTQSVDTTSGARMTWGMGASIRAGARATFDASVRHDAFDPVSLAPSQTSWSIGLSLALGSIRRPPAAPVPAAYRGGNATIEVPVAAVAAGDTPSVAGDFNHWTPAPMRREGAFWTLTLPVAPGVYNYSFVSARGDWFVPDGVPGRKDDGMGGQVAVLVVR